MESVVAKITIGADGRYEVKLQLGMGILIME